MSWSMRSFACLSLLIAVLAPAAAFAEGTAPADSTYFTLEAEGASVGWMSCRKTTLENGDALYLGSGVLRGTTTLHWSAELTPDLTRLIAVESYTKTPDHVITSRSTFKERGGKPDLVFEVDGQRYPAPVEDVKAGAVLVPSMIVTGLAPLSDRLAGENPLKLDITLHATNGAKAIQLHVQGKPDSRVTVRGEDVPVRTFLLTASRDMDEPVEIRLYQRPDGAFYGVQTGGMSMFATGGAGEIRPQPRDYPQTVQADGVDLPGVLTLPPRPEEGEDAPVAAVLMVAGPGQVGMDDASAGFRFYAHLAEQLSLGGVASLRYAPRDTLPGPDAMTTLAADAGAALAILRESPAIDGAKVLLLGHGEGAMLLGEIAAAAEATGVPVTGLILLGGVTVPGAELQAVAPRPADAPWLESFLAYDPRVHLAGSTLPVLLLHGELDAEVPSDNATGLKAFFNETGHMRVSCTVAKNMNHWLQKAETGAVAEYPDLEPACADGIAKRVTSFVGFCTR